MEKSKESNAYAEERELLHKQLHLLAEQSKGCMPMELAALSEQMVAIYSILTPNLFESFSKNVKFESNAIHS